MGGVAVVIDWNQPVDPERFDAMCARIDHRATAGLETTYPQGAALAEGRLSRDGTDGWHIAKDGPLSIVGDIRLWNRDALRAITGGEASADNLDDRHLLLAAFRRRGAQMMLVGTVR